MKIFYLLSCKICDTTCETINTIGSVNVAKKNKLSAISRPNTNIF